MPAACPRCGSAVAPSARRCPQCATALAGGGSPVQLSTPRPAQLPAPAPPAAGAPGGPPAKPTAEVLVDGARAGVRGGAKLWRRTPRSVRLVLAGVVAALVIGVPATLWVVGRVAYAPDEPVEDLVAALNDGDLRRVATLAGCTSRLCRPDALAEGYEPPTEVSVADVAMGGESSPDTADITIRYRLAGERRESIVRVRRESGVLPQDWAIVSGVTGNLEIVAPAVRTVRVAAVDLAVPAGDGGRTGRTPVLLGAYTVRVAPEDRLYEAEPVTAAVTGDLRSRASTTVTLTPTVRAALDTQARQQIRTFLEECARSDAYSPKIADRACPFEHTWPVPDMSSPASWTIDPFPEIELVPPDKSAGEPQLTVRTKKDGRATVTYTSRGRAETHPHSFSVRGTVTIDAAGTAVWKP